MNAAWLVFVIQVLASISETLCWWWTRESPVIQHSKINGEKLLQIAQEDWNTKITWVNDSKSGKGRVFMRCFEKNKKNQDKVNSGSFILLLFVKHGLQWKPLSVFDVDSCKGHITRYVTCISLEEESTRLIQVEYKEEEKKECLLFELPENGFQNIKVTVEDTDEKCLAQKFKWFSVKEKFVNHLMYHRECEGVCLDCPKSALTKFEENHPTLNLVSANCE
ncbi:uncharacterized protein LOC129000969 isoform X2 [Macrosteles quadrilineatus]|uniref:uncharacterized protein LOC129000831 isoform X2 n=1 Tax=Macrosteles quadrilineatus TaxID=74068 RepID=UPI0023E25475|nr:uncharacterized protein LOC129000831 isoform X2 [Macrosteles quadrilineatus]XP_054284053.1 uncharacterized protein LOC129000969 isoform X2 [Macrosteles quadrilineatus]